MKEYTLDGIIEMNFARNTSVQHFFREKQATLRNKTDAKDRKDTTCENRDMPYAYTTAYGVTI